MSRQFISALTGFDVAHAHDHLPLPIPLRSYFAFIVCLLRHTALRTSVAQRFLAAEATLFHVLMPTENVNLYNASQVRFSTFVHELRSAAVGQKQCVHC